MPRQPGSRLVDAFTELVAFTVSTMRSPGDAPDSGAPNENVPPQEETPQEVPDGGWKRGAFDPAGQRL